jgi:hypothetical protein
MPMAIVRGLNINYEIVGDAGPWVALITGGRRGYQEFLPLAGKIAAEGFPRPAARPAQYRRFGYRA